jgi:hypothetical protein
MSIRMLAHMVEQNPHLRGHYGLQLGPGEPDFRFVEMRPRPIDLGIVDVANRTFESMGTWKTAVQWLLWLGFGTVLAAIFYVTR